MGRIHDTWADSDTPIMVELYYSSAWHDVTSDLGDAGVTITPRGRTGDLGHVSATQCTVQLANPLGTYCPRNPNGALYGLIGRNTPIRVSVTLGGITYPRFTGQVSAWPTKWGVKGAESAYAALECAGVLRRIGQGSAPLQSSYRRACVGSAAAISNLAAYWPMEDGADAERFASGLPGGPEMTYTGSASLASDTDTFACSTALPVPGSGFSAWTQVPYSAPTGEIQVRCLLSVPSAGISTTSRLLHVIAADASARRWDLTLKTDGALILKAYEDGDSSTDTGTAVLDTGAITFACNGKRVRLHLSMINSGSDVVYKIATLEVGAVGGNYYSGTLAGYQVGRCSRIGISPDGGIDGVTIGHVTVQTLESSVFELKAQFNAYIDELASARLSRLCAEEGITYAALGSATTSAMGYQKAGALTDLLMQAQDSDHGILYEPRDGDGLTYRVGRDLYTQDPALTLAYIENGLVPFEPSEDDSATRNLVTVARIGGSSSTSEVTDGPLSTQEPPDGVGIYGDSVSLSLADDSQVADQASWLSHLGTVDEPRWEIGVELADPRVQAAGLPAGLLALDLGDRIVVTGPPAWLPPGPIDVLIQSITETITPARYTISLGCTPASGYRVGVWDSTSARYSGAGTTLNGAITASATSVTITPPTGVTWSHGDGDFDVVVDGERMTVTGVAGNVLTVTRSVNGVVKAHASGASLDLYEPCYIGL